MGRGEPGVSAGVQAGTAVSGVKDEEDPGMEERQRSKTKVMERQGS